MGGGHRRRSLRLRGYSYASPGAYFVTLCTQGRACVFGNIMDAILHRTDAGGMIETAWRELPAFYPGVNIDEFVIMPNHVHGIVVLVGAAPRWPPRFGAGTGACPYNGFAVRRCATVQDHYDMPIRHRRQRAALAVLSRASLAARLL